MLIRHHLVQRGFTLVELMVGIAIVAILLTQGIPYFSDMLQNMQIRSSAESILNGLQLAKAQAVRSNLNVEFLLTNTAPSAANAQTAVANANGTNWIIRNTSPIDPIGGWNPDADFIQGRSGQDGTGKAIVTADPGSGTASGGPFVSGSYIFTPLGRLLNPPPAVGGNEPLIDIDVDIADVYTNKRKMCIIISASGQILMCDPNRVDANNPQYCPILPAPHCV